ncbi:MAG: isopeptide-forming domain-containing fimbrial protein [Clostridiales bacterium]|nr:isopeptide-forming domain-containing fimbrial protein [Clostridiales bacterium]
MKKKGIKRLLAMVFAFVLMFSCMSTAWAADEGKIKITNVQSANHTYEAYQIFSGTVSGDTIGNIVWGGGISEDRTYTDDNNETVTENIYTALAKLTVTAGVYPFASCKTAAEVAAVLANYSDDSDMLLLFADCVADFVTTSTGTVTYAQESDGSYTYTISGLTSGYYLVIDETDSSLIGSGEAYTHYIVQVVGTAEISVKEVNPTVKKVIDDGTDDGTNATSASAGDTVTFKLTGTIPSDLSAYSSYTYQFVDTLSKNLSLDESSITVVAEGYVATSDLDYDSSKTYYTYDKSSGVYSVVTGISVFADNTTYYEKDTKTLTAGTNNDYVVETSTDTSSGKTTLTITLNDAKSLAGYTITVTYEATLKADAVAGTAETNSVYLVYSNNPNGNGTGETTMYTVYVHTFDLVVNKTDGTDGLAGAGFTLYKQVSITSFESGVTYFTYSSGDTAMTEVTDTSGTPNSNTDYYVAVGSEVSVDDTTYKATFNDLGEGTYVLVETTTPNGYNTTAAVKFEITATYDTTDGSTVTKLETDNATVTADTTNTTTTLTTTVINQAGSELPETGGRGTTMFYIIGGILVFGAAVLLITRRRMGREE